MIHEIKTRGDLIKRVNKNVKKWRNYKTAAEVKLKKVLSGLVGYDYWLKWEAPRLAYADKMLQTWENIARGIAPRRDGKRSTFEDTVKFMQGMRDGVVERLLSVQSSNDSANRMANYLRDIEQDVLREVVGKSLMNTDTLAGILSDCGVKKL